MSELDTATIEYGEQVPVDTLAREERQRKMSYGAMRSSANNPWSHPTYEVPTPRDTEEDILDWQKDALCSQTDPEAFFPEKGGSTRDAKKVCASCDVTDQCLVYALNNDERFGIWGGLSERERRRLKRRV
ncbi:MAG TPA: WhiB family transcriptional regulator [Dongiaceae bacterium]|nr:WhiB family transcriptional regulator [Dongiaceae bacterium]